MNRSRYLIVIGVVIIVAAAIGGIYYSNSKTGNKTYLSNNTAKKTPSTSQNNPNVNNSVLVSRSAAGIGTYLAEPNGYPLYTYSADKPGVSNCSGSCLALWPAYLDQGSTTNLPPNVGTFVRTDNHKVQYTYKGLPLYTFSSDKPGSVTGNGVAGFSVARP
jgi:predicted lipoprotein with Yx(FWY)xxD motif